MFKIGIYKITNRYYYFFITQDLLYKSAIDATGVSGDLMFLHNDNVNHKLLYFKNISELGSLHKNIQDFITKVVWVYYIVYSIILFKLSL